MEGLYKLISDTQATLFLLFHKTWEFHWNVVGPNFQQLHTLFGKQYEEMFEELDRFSEHMRFLNIRPVGSLTRIVEVSSVAEGSNIVQMDEMGQKQIIPGNPIVKAEDMVNRLLSDNMVLLEILTVVSEQASQQGFYATDNIVQDMMELHGKFVWMLRSIAEKSNTAIEDNASYAPMMGGQPSAAPVPQQSAPQRPSMPPQQPSMPQRAPAPQAPLQ
jgi:starvation-inducible DNA-binding protein